MSDKYQALPAPTPETQHFWDSAKEGELKLRKSVV